MAHYFKPKYCPNSVQISHLNMHIVVMHRAIFFLAPPLSGGFVGIWMPPILGSSRGLALDYFFASTRKDGVGVLVEKLLAWVGNQ
jgi:hypothetical protein